MTTTKTPVRRPPWHLWVVAILTLLWNGSGADTILMAQAGRLAGMFAIATDIALVLPIAAAAALLLRSRNAVWLFALSLIVLVSNTVYDVAAGTSLARVDRGWLMTTILIGVISVLQFVYARTMGRRVVLH